MAWLKIDKVGNEYIIDYQDKRIVGCGGFIARKVEIRLPKGSIKKLIGRELSWSDEPVELK